MGGSSLECVGSTLLCAEEDSSVFDDVDVDDDDVDVDFQVSNLHNNLFKQHPPFHFMQIQTHHYLASLFHKETHHLPAPDYLHRLRTGVLDLQARNEAMDWIHKVQSHYNFGPLCLFLAINYFDRFLSMYQLPTPKAWMMQLLAVACLSLAAKMEETQVPFLLDLQVGEAKFIFEAKTIQRMELLVMSTLKWRMQAVTPFAFIDYYLYKINGDQMPSTSSIIQSNQLILSTVKGIDFLEFRASEIAGAVAFCVAQNNQIPENTDKLFSLLCHHISKEKLSKCVELMDDLRKGGGIGSSSSMPQSPNGVLDAAKCLSDINSTPSTSCDNSTHNTPAPKKRKLATSS